MMNIKGTVLLGVVALSVVLTAATSAESNKKPDLPMDTIRAQQNQETVLNEAKDGLEFTVTLNKARFTLQDEIKVHVKVTNVSDKEIPFFCWGSSVRQCVHVAYSRYGKSLSTLLISHQNTTYLQIKLCRKAICSPAHRLNMSEYCFPK